MNRTYTAFVLLFVVGALVLAWQFLPNAYALERCMKLAPGPRTACFQEVIDEAAKRGDYTEAFDIVARGYDLDTDFAANCHASAHEIGELAYERFRRGEDAVFTSKASFCGYGFYHGFMEALLAENGDIDEARGFCNLLGEELLLETADARGACYHGIGHGTVDGTDPRVWGDPHGLVAEGIEMCELVAGALPDTPKDRGPLYRCTTGAYNSLEILSQNEKYGLQALAKDPFGFCASELGIYRGGCYTNMIPAVMRLRSDDFKLVVSDIESIPSIGDEAHASLVFDLFHEFIRLHIAQGLDAGVEAVPLCHSLRDPLRIGCIEGLSGGYLKYGAPEHEAEGMLHFCALSQLAPDEVSACFYHSLTRLRNFYSPEETKATCLRAPEEFQHFCERGAQRASP